MALPDLTSALESFQQALTAGVLRLSPGTLDSELYVLMDRPNGELRLTYVRLDGETVSALVQYIHADEVEGEPCFSVGWAVPEAFRGHGRSGELFIASLKELQHGLARQGLLAFWVEGVVGTDNLASQRMAERVISEPKTTGMDSHAGVPVVQYLRRVDTDSTL